jgi:chromatin segregation and condensation protein Rec8/ScpA/Scc1 (kleisin family)
MPIELARNRGTILIRRSAFERAGLTRSAIDQRYNLTDQEFHVEEDLVVIGPLPSEDMLTEVIEDLEQNGLTYFDEFFDLSGNWPAWLAVYARSRDRQQP